MRFGQNDYVWTRSTFILSLYTCQCWSFTLSVSIRPYLNCDRNYCITAVLQTSFVRLVIAFVFMSYVYNFYVYPFRAACPKLLAYTSHGAVAVSVSVIIMLIHIHDHAKLTFSTSKRPFYMSISLTILGGFICSNVLSELFLLERAAQLLLIMFDDIISLHS